jgi:uncharacterized protein (TIGR00369 family)
MRPNEADYAAAMPFATLIGLELLDASAEEVRARLAWAPQRCTSGGILHGGALMTLADSTGGLCAYLNLPPGATTATVESKTNFFRPVSGGYAESVSHLIHRGRNFLVVHTEVWDTNGRRVALTIQTQAIIPRVSPEGTQTTDSKSA